MHQRKLDLFGIIFWEIRRRAKPREWEKKNWKVEKNVFFLRFFFFCSLYRSLSITSFSFWLYVFLEFARSREFFCAHKVKLLINGHTESKRISESFQAQERFFSSSRSFSCIQWAQSNGFHLIRFLFSSVIRRRILISVTRHSKLRTFFDWIFFFRQEYRKWKALIRGTWTKNAPKKMKNSNTFFSRLREK